MKKSINNSEVSFLDENGNEIMYIDFCNDECLWYFNSSEGIIVTEEDELYHLLKIWMEQDYTFDDNSILKNYKNDNKIKWYSDCSYNPDKEYSIKSVSCLNIEYNKNYFKIWCDKELDKIINRPKETHCIAFSPSNNGQYSCNEKTGSTFQDDFILIIYHQLLQNYVKKKMLI